MPFFFFYMLPAFLGNILTKINREWKICKYIYTISCNIISIKNSTALGKIPYYPS